MSNEKDTNNIPPSEEDNTKTKKHETWCVLLYPEDPLHNEAIAMLTDDRRAVGILHDKDIDEDGNVKKAHYHFVIKLPSPGTTGSIQRIIPNVKENYIKPCKSMRGACRYLIHKDNPEKEQYKQDDIVGNIKLAKRYLNTNDDEADDVSKILEYVEAQEHTIRTADVLRFALDNNLYSVYRRGASIINALIKEHNAYIYDLSKGSYNVEEDNLKQRREDLKIEEAKIQKRLDTLAYFEENIFKGENEQCFTME